MSEEDGNISNFPSGRKREGLVVLRAANDSDQRRPSFNLPPVIRVLTVACCAVFAAIEIYALAAGRDKADALVFQFAFIPARYNSKPDVFSLLAPLTYLFLHGGFAHLAANVLSLAAFGTGVERWLGPRRMLLLYTLAGLTGAAAHYALDPLSPAPLIGASGAISGLFGALAVGLNGTNTRGLLILGAIWAGSSALIAWTGLPGSTGEIAWITHVGGFGAGIALALFWARRKR